MPLFEYLCKDCNKVYTKLIPQEDSTCECGSEGIKQISTPSPAIIPGGTYAGRNS